MKPETRKGFRFGLKKNWNPPLNTLLNQTWHPFGFQAKGKLTKPETLSGFKQGGLNQTWDPWGFQRGV